MSTYQSDCCAAPVTIMRPPQWWECTKCHNPCNARPETVPPVTARHALKERCQHCDLDIFLRDGQWVDRSGLDACCQLTVDGEPTGKIIKHTPLPEVK